MKEVFSKVAISPKAKFVTFIAVEGYYRDSLSIKEALEPDTMAAYKVNGKELAQANGFPVKIDHPEDVCL